MAGDNQTGTTITEPKSAMDLQLVQARTAAAQAASKYKKDPSAENANAYALATIDALTIELQQSVVGANKEGAAVLAKMRPELLSKLKGYRAALANSAEEKNQTLNMELSQKQRDQVDKQQRDFFDLSMSGQRSTISLLGTAKGFAALLQAFGIDTREFMDMCDQGMKEAKSKVEGMDYKALEKPSRTIDTTGGERRLSAAEAKIPADLAEAMAIYDQERAKLMGAAGSGNPKQTATAEQKISENKFAPKANETSYSTAEVIAAIGKDGLAGVKADPAKLKSTIEKTAALDGNAASLSSSELIELNKKMLVITGSQAATDKIMSGIKSHPNRPDDGPGTTPGPQAKANIAAPSLEYNK